MKQAKRLIAGRVTILLALVATALAFSGAMAVATPGAPTMGVGGLASQLEAAPDGSLTGYFQTVVRGDTVSEVPVTILAVTGDSSSALILFESSGPIIDKAGGIAAGMSGSPLYIEAGDNDVLVGAVSYGDYFTLGGTGLATPIEAMMDIETRYAPTVERLEAPVLAGGSVISSIIVAPNPEDYAGAAEEGALVAKPLASVFLGGLRPQSVMYKRLAADMKSQGVNLVPLATRLGGTAMKNGEPYSAPFEPGGSVGALAARGDLWFGGLGTVTYTSDNVVLAFGHPAFWDGPTSLYMTNAWIDGIWPSQMEPYKLGRPGAVHGAITQDRSSGIMGRDDLELDETVVTAQATRVETQESTTSAVYFPTDFLSINDGRSMLAASGAYVAGSRLFDQLYAPGSAVTTTTIVVDDGTETHTIEMPNMVDSDYDVAAAAVDDVYAALGQLLSITDSGLAQPRILSVDVTSEISSERKNAQIIDVIAPNGLVAGEDNAVKVSLLKYGVAATQTVDATISIPAGTPIPGGTLSASAYGSEYDMGDEMMDEELMDEWYESYYYSDRRSVAEVVDELNAAPGNNTMTISFYPGFDFEYGYPFEDEDEESPDAVAETLVTVDSVLTGAAQKSATGMSARVSSKTVSYGGAVELIGQLYGVDEPAAVYVYGTEAGQSTEKLLGEAFVLTGNDDLPWYIFQTSGLKKNISLRVVYSGDE
ncbi:MAG TPA: hypothetical protein VLA05_12700 [Coriobacteriia bacterium]|nr:hypothetical protein [Coriobacteriia bacterium]